MVLVHRLPEHVEARGRQLLDADVQRMPRELLDLHVRDAMRTVEVSLLEQLEERAIVRRVVLGQLLVEEHRQLLDIVLCWIGRVFHAVSHVQSDESTRFNLDCQRRLAVGLNLDRQGCLAMRPRELALGLHFHAFEHQACLRLAILRLLHEGRSSVRLFMQLFLPQWQGSKN